MITDEPLWIDAHVHLDAMDDAQRARALERVACGRYRAMIPGVRPSQWAEARRLFGDQGAIDFAVGIHPWEIDDTWDGSKCDAWMEALRQSLERPRVVAIGEIGLDWVRHKDKAQRVAAERLFAGQLELAVACEMPVVLHVVRAHARCVEMLKDLDGRVSGMVHAFSGSLEEARAYTTLGLAIGLGSLITRPQARKVVDAARDLAAGSWVLETDAPFMATGTEPKGSGCTGGIQVVALEVAKQRGLSVAAVCEESRSTYMRCFHRAKPKTA